MFFFFKQKTAYEMRISDWSSDVCSSDLHPATRHCAVADPQAGLNAQKQNRPIRQIVDVQYAFGQRDATCAKYGLDLVNGSQNAAGVGFFAERSEERRVGNECVSTCRSRWWPYN